ncbi:hypothetical protein [Actinoplanes sp. G11-F43]|uniref:hypothetical protein n=1 Tax=Actinoplanes sp. G11-F43 TaxID=3424130 RepID=UPI003D32DB8A
MRGEDEMIDDDAGRLLRPLRAEPDGPPRVDVGRAMAEGRRRRGLRRWSGGVALVALTSVTAGGGTLAIAASRPDQPRPEPAPVVSTSPSVQVAAAPAVAPPTSCEVVKLPTGGVRKSLITSGDPSGRYHAGRLYDAADNLIVWKDGKIDARFRMPGLDASIYDMTSTGAGVGSSYPGEGQQAYSYRDGTVTELDGRRSAAYAINEAGVIAGVTEDDGREVPVRWRSAGAPMERLPLPSGATSGRAGDIAEDGTVVGVVGEDRAQETGYLWLPDGTGKAIPLPTVEGRKADFFRPAAITDGWVLGVAIVEGGTDGVTGEAGKAGSVPIYTSLRYRLSDRTYHPVPSTVDADQLAGNGWILGTTGKFYQPVIASGDEVFKLPLYADFKEYDVRSLSADGRIAGGYTTDMGPEEVDNRPILWTCE